MIDIKLNEHSAEDVKEIEKLRAMGVPEDVIQMGYDNTQSARKSLLEDRERQKSVIEIIENAIKEELNKYAATIEKELEEEYKKEFENRLREHRRKVVLDVCENIKMQEHYNHRDMETKIQITI